MSEWEEGGRGEGEGKEGTHLSPNDELHPTTNWRGRERGREGGKEGGREGRVGGREGGREGRESVHIAL